METIVAALISATAAIVVCVITNRSQQKKTEALIEYKLDTLTERVDKHNNLVERMYHIEEVAAVYEEKMSVANHRIEDLEKHTGCHSQCGV